MENREKKKQTNWRLWLPLIPTFIFSFGFQIIPVFNLVRSSFYAEKTGVTLDYFKQVNDTYGHKEGDLSLKAVSNYIIYNVATLPNVKAGRWGGEEFMILLYNSSDADAYKLAENLRTNIKTASSSQTDITISVGVTKYRENENITNVINRVDELMYKAKELGKDQVNCDFME